MKLAAKYRVCIVSFVIWPFKVLWSEAGTIHEPHLLQFRSKPMHLRFKIHD